MLFGMLFKRLRIIIYIEIRNIIDEMSWTFRDSELDRNNETGTKYEMIEYWLRTRWRKRNHSIHPSIIYTQTPSTHTPTPTHTHPNSPKPMHAGQNWKFHSSYIIQKYAIKYATAVDRTQYLQMLRIEVWLQSGALPSELKLPNCYAAKIKK